MPKSIQGFEIVDYLNNTSEDLLNNQPYFTEAQPPFAYIPKGMGYAHAYYPAPVIGCFCVMKHERADWLADPSSENPNTQLRQKGSYRSRTAKINK